MFCTELVHHNNLEKQGQTRMHLINMNAGVENTPLKVFCEYISGTRAASRALSSEVVVTAELTGKLTSDAQLGDALLAQG